MESNDKLEQLLKQMYSEETLHDDDIDTSDIIDEEWTKFEAEHFRSERLDVRGKRIPFLKFAAMIIGILMLSGISYATIYIISSNSQKAEEEQTIATANPQFPTLNSQLAEQDSYQVEPVYKKEATKHIRLYFTWDKKQDLDNIIDTFNKFERIHITRYDKILIVE